MMHVKLSEKSRAMILQLAQQYGWEKVLQVVQEAYGTGERDNLWQSVAEIDWNISKAEEALKNLKTIRKDNTDAIHKTIDELDRAVYRLRCEVQRLYPRKKVI